MLDREKKLSNTYTLFNPYITKKTYIEHTLCYEINLAVMVKRYS